MAKTLIFNILFMISFKLLFFLYLYYFFLAVWLVFFGISIYHIVKFGFKNKTTFAFLGIFIAASVLVLSTTAFLLMGVDWNEEVGLFGGVGGAYLEE
jgi:hypothetical protein